MHILVFITCVYVDMQEHKILLLYKTLLRSHWSSAGIFNQVKPSNNLKGMLQYPSIVTTYIFFKLKHCHLPNYIDMLWKYVDCCRLVLLQTTYPSQMISRLTFDTKFDHLYNFFFLSWLGLLIKVLQEWLKFDFICTNFLNKTSGQTWNKKSQTSYNLEWREYKRSSRIHKFAIDVDIYIINFDIYIWGMHEYYSSAQRNSTHHRWQTEFLVDTGTRKACPCPTSAQFATPCTLREKKEGKKIAPSTSSIRR